MSDKKFFDSSIVPMCRYCKSSREISGGMEYFCVKKGEVEPTDSCRKYEYDVLKRTPKVQGLENDFKPSDFKL